MLKTINHLKKNKVFKGFTLCLNRVAVLYLFIFLLCFIFVDTKEIRIKTLNHLKPVSFEYLIQGEDGEGNGFNSSKMRAYLKYYKKITKYMPSISSAHGILGFCHYQLGHDSRAIRALKKAQAANPSFLWFHYNLGVIYYKQGKYQKAIENLEKATATSLAENLNYIEYSKPYQPILSTTFRSNQELVSTVQKRYRQSYQLLVLSHYHLKQYHKMMFYAKMSINPNFKKQDFFYFYAGLGAYMLGEYAQAVPILKESIRLNPKHANAYYYFGLSLKEVGHHALSKKMINQSLVLNVHENHELKKVENEIDVTIF